MMKLTFGAAFPFCPIPLATEWDGETFFNGLASSSTEKYVPVYGEGTWFPTPPMYQGEVAKIFWGTNKSKLKFSGFDWQAFSNDIPGPPAEDGLVGERHFSFDYEETVFDRIIRADDRVCGNGSGNGIPFISVPSPEPAPDEHENYVHFPCTGGEIDTPPFPLNPDFAEFYYTGMFGTDKPFPQLVRDADGNYYPQFRCYIPYGALGNFYHDFPDPPPDDFPDGREWLLSWNLMYFDTLKYEDGPDYDNRKFPTKLAFYSDDISRAGDGIQLFMADNETDGPEWPTVSEISLARQMTVGMNSTRPGKKGLPMRRARSKR